MALVTLVTVGAAGAYTYAQPKVYRSSMKIVVGQGEGIFLPEVGNVAEQFTQTMSNLLQSDVVALRVIGDLGLHLSPDQLLQRLRVTTKPESAVLEVHYDDSDGRLASRILDRVGQVFTELVDERLARSGNTSTTQVSATIFDPAHLLPDPVQPQPTRNLAVAGLLGLLLGALAGFAREHVDDTIRGLDKAEQAFGQTATATLPPGLVGHRPLEPTHRRKHDTVLAEMAFQRLRASVLWSTEARDVRSLLVTSAHPEEGKTTVASNLALTLANEGHDVIVVEADLRRPALSRFLALRPKTGTPGIDAILRGQATIADALVEVPLTFSGLPSGNGNRSRTTPRRERTRGRLRAVLTRSDEAWAPGRVWPAEFGLIRTAEVVKELAEQADYVVIDSPPILVVTDAYPFAAAADSVIAIVRNHRSTATATQAMTKALERLEAQRVQLLVTDVERRFGMGYYYGRYGRTPRRERSRSPSVSS